jgi:adenine deaminase
MAAPMESYAGKIQRKLLKKQRVIEAASGREKADLVLKNATYVNVFSNELRTCDIAVANGLIVGMGEYEGEQELDMTGKIVCPGFVDAHIHLESSLVSPREFAKAVLPHGTTTVITDPHEITNVMGTDGIDYMFQATEGLPIDVRFMLPSCVPATPMDESGANLDYRAIDSFYDYPRVQGLAEMMNAYGVIHNDAEVVSKIIASQAHHKKIDGHAPGLTGKDLDTYIAAGVYSDHECSDIEDALAKLRRGQFIMIREGTAARNLEALAPLLTPQYADRCMFCTDDKHPSDLLEKGHIDYICREAINKYGVDPIIAVKAACHHASRYFLLNNRGAIAPGYLADFAIIDNFQDFNVEMVFKKGVLYYDHGQLKDFPKPQIEEYLDQRAHDTFHVTPLTEDDFRDVRPRAVIGMVPGEIVTTDNGYADKVDTEKDILKIAVVERHKNTHHIGLGYIQGYGLKSGAVATSISHDSHNIIVVGTNSKDMAFAVNRIVENHGGIVVTENEQVKSELVLELAGIMSDSPLVEVNEKLEAAKDAAHALGVGHGIDPFMTLSFMALPVIPTLRITTRGIIDVVTQQYI